MIKAKKINKKDLVILNQHLKDNNQGLALKELYNLIEDKKGGIAKFSEENGIARNSLYKQLSTNGNPLIGTLMPLLNKMGLKFHFIAKNQPERSKREEGCTGECSPNVPLMLLDEWPNPLYPGSVEKVRSMRCSEHCSNAVRDKSRKSPPE